MLQSGVSPSPIAQREIHGGVLAGLTVVVTGGVDGYSREAITAAIKYVGGKAATSVSAKTNFLVVGESPGASKLKKAQDLDVRLVDGASFGRLLSGEISVDQLEDYVS